MYESTTPGKTACASASPMKAKPAQDDEAADQPAHAAHDRDLQQRVLHERVLRAGR